MFLLIQSTLRATTADLASTRRIVIRDQRTAARAAADVGALAAQCETLDTKLRSNEADNARLRAVRCGLFCSVLFVMSNMLFR
jgi:hypothetical protein